MIWQVILGSGQQRPIAFRTFLVLFAVADTTAAAITRPVASTLALLTASFLSLSVHFYMCRTELFENRDLNSIKSSFNTTVLEIIF